MPTNLGSDVETGLGRPGAPRDEEVYDGADENQALLANDHDHQSPSSLEKSEISGSGEDTPVSSTKSTDGYQVGAKRISNTSYYAQLIGAFVVGVLVTVGTHLALARCSHSDNGIIGHLNAQAVPPYVGSSEVHHFPPAKPTNKFPEYFPSNVGYAGVTPTGAEPAIVATAPAWPMHTGAPHLVVPTHLDKASQHHVHVPNEGGDSDGLKKGKKRKFNMLEKWGNLSPWYSIERGGFGVDSGPETPETCRVTGLHFVHRHGARYPTEWGTYSFCRLLDLALTVFLS